jgi:hypothetical protein
VYEMSASDVKSGRICVAGIKAGLLKLLEDTLFKLRKPHAHSAHV